MVQNQESAKVPFLFKKKKKKKKKKKHFKAFKN